MSSSGTARDPRPHPQENAVSSRSTAADAAVQGYLDRLSAATSTLAPGDRSELVQQITDHLAAARADARADGLTDDEALVRTFIEDLGTPEQVAAAAGAAPSATATAPAKGRAIAAMVLGIAAVALVLIAPPLTLFSIVMAVVGLVLGLLALRAARKNPATHGGRGQAITGVVLSAVPLLGVFFYLSRYTGLW